MSVAPKLLGADGVDTGADDCRRFEHGREFPFAYPLDGLQTQESILHLSSVPIDLFGARKWNDGPSFEELCDA
jgi:hypothetical protein